MEASDPFNVDCPMKHVINHHGQVISYMHIGEAALAWWYGTGHCVYDPMGCVRQLAVATLRIELPWLPVNITKEDLDKYLTLL